MMATGRPIFRTLSNTVFKLLPERVLHRRLDRGGNPLAFSPVP